MKKVLGLIAGSMLLAAPALAADAVYNCDYAPSCEVAPGIYGKMSSPVQSKFNLSIGGYVKLDYAYNSSNLGVAGMISPSTGLFPSRNINAAGSVPANNAALQAQSIMSVDQSRLWFKVAGPTFLGAKTNALIEGDFYGTVGLYGVQESPGFRARLAYGTLDWANTQVLFGQFWDVFGPMVASTQDFRSGATTGAPNTPRTPQLRLTQKINFNENNQLKLVAGVVDPQQGGNNSLAPAAPNAGSYANMPNFAGQAMFISKALGTSPGYFGMSMNPLTVGVFGQYGTVKNNVTNLGQSVPTWGAGVYAFVPVLKSKDGKSRAMTMSLEAQAYEAANMAYNAATAATVLNVAGTAGAISQNAAKGIGYTGQVMFFPTQDLGITAGYGRRQALNNRDYTVAAVGPNYAQFTQQIYANVSYDLNAAVRVAAEYQNFETQYGNFSATGAAGTGTHGLQTVGTDNTIRLCAYYFF